jgi:TolB-like protein/Tfp pilus assembly protein PilF
MSHNEPPSPITLAKARADDFLDSWKEIAAYLGREVRTVQRWEKAAGLPVHRLQVEKQGSVYAYKSELDVWYRERQPRLEPEAEHAEGAGAGTRQHVRWSIVGGLLAVVGLVSVGTYLACNGRWLHKHPIARKIKLAVLPFVNLSGDPAQEYFSDGMTEEMITQLSRVQPVRLGVIARTSAMLYKNAQKGTPQICHELGVDYVLEGSVRRAGNRARITVQLIQCSDQTHVWADNSERDLTNILVLQADVAQAIARRINLQLTPQQRPDRAPQSLSAAVYTSYLHGRYYSNQQTKDGLEKGIGYFEQAIQGDRTYGPAHAGLAFTYESLGTYGYWPPQTAFPKAKTAATRALEVDPNSAEAHTTLGAVHEFYDWNWAAAAEEYERAIELDPGDGLARLHSANHLLIMGQTKESFGELSRALEIDPLSPIFSTEFCIALQFAREYDRAIEVCNERLERDPNNPIVRSVLADTYEAKGLHEQSFEQHLQWLAATGRKEFADRLIRTRADFGFDRAKRIMDRTHLEDLQEDSKRQYVPAVEFAWAYLDLGDYDRALEWLDKACKERSTQMLYLKLYPRYDPLRPDARFQGLIRRVGLPQ